LPLDSDLKDFLVNDDEETPESTPEDPVDAQGKAVYETPVIDMSIEAEMPLHQGEEPGVIEQYAANEIAENLIPQVDKHSQHLEAIIDYKMMILLSSGNRSM